MEMTINDMVKAQAEHEASTPKYNPKSVPCLLGWKWVNDSAELECEECSETLDVEGWTEDVTYTNDHFNGAHYQTEEYGREFSTEYFCPACGHHNKVKEYQL